VSFPAVIEPEVENLPPLRANYGVAIFSRIQPNIFDALLSSLLDPLEGLSMVNCEKLELGGAPDFQH
jgi:hypothetical protein